ncbi:helix-turn-helix transcriptional regulator [Actinophytocola sp.]|jgi:transcriptional regulator with XRE-family HTH domain|uniref:helix-turn-helix domain-containing protein n=1 Tax=Actinophytocola sp. TaxID=1872138 RepID=UPI002ED7D6D2
MDTALTGVTDDAITRLLGEELRRARDALGLTRAELIDRMPSKIHPQTLATYESGARQCTVIRLIEICRALGVAAPDILSLSLQRAKAELYTLTLLIDLPALMYDDADSFDQVRTWARLKLEEPEGKNIAWLEPPAVREMAFIFGMPRTELVAYLATFAPRAAPRGDDQ